MEKKYVKISGGAEMVLALRRGRVIKDKKKEKNKKNCRRWRHSRDRDKEDY